MAETSKVSIIIPCYNVAKYVTRCVESILGQGYDNIEITEHERFEFSSPSGCFAKSCEKYIDRFNRSGLLFRLSAYRLLGVRSSVKSILKHGL